MNDDFSPEYVAAYNEGARLNYILERYAERRSLASSPQALEGFWAAITDGNTSPVDAPVQLFLDLFSVVGLAE